MLHNLKVTKRLFAVRGHHSLLWPNNTAFARSQRGYFGTKDVIIEDHQKVIYAKVGTAFESNRGAICRQKSSDFIVDRGYNIIEVVKGLFVTKGSHSMLLQKATSI